MDLPKLEGVTAVGRDEATGDLVVDFVTGAEAHRLTVTDAAAAGLVTALMAMPQPSSGERTEFRPILPRNHQLFSIPALNMRGLSFGLDGGLELDIAIPPSAIAGLIAALQTIERGYKAGQQGNVA